MNFRPPSQVQPSFKTRTQGMKLADLPNDIGVLPGTFVRPLWRDMPSIFTAPRDRWHMEYTWLKSWLSNFARLVLPESLEYSVRSTALVLVKLS
jgi:protein MBA1